MKRSLYILLVTVILMGWRGMWLASAVPDTTAFADVAAALAQQRLAQQSGRPQRWRVSFAAWERGEGDARLPITLRDNGLERWDNMLPVWITPGRDGQPGWASWDDDGDGVIDNEGELGAAWSDDFCVVQWPGEPRPFGRIIDRGAFRPLEGQPPSDAITQQRFVVVQGTPDR